MNASKRWAYHYASNLECVTCRAKRPLTLYQSDGTILMSEKKTVEWLRNNHQRIDAWCNTCPAVWGRKAKSAGRCERRFQAFELANLQVASQTASRYDEYRDETGDLISKQAWWKAYLKTAGAVDVEDENGKTLHRLLYLPTTLEEFKKACHAGTLVYDPYTQ